RRGVSFRQWREVAIAEVEERERRENLFLLFDREPLGVGFKAIDLHAMVDRRRRVATTLDLGRQILTVDGQRHRGIASIDEAREHVRGRASGKEDVDVE